MTYRAFISVILSVFLALTSQAMAVTRGAAAATDQVVICNGSGTMVLFVDAEGQPTAAPHICPDCALSDGYSHQAGLCLIPEQLTAPEPQLADTQGILPVCAENIPPARAPPVLV